MNIFDPFFFQAMQQPNRPALVFPGGYMTYGQLASAATSASAAIASAGFRPKELVAIELPVPIYQIIVIIALGRLGIPSINISSALGAQTTLDVKGYIGDRTTLRFGDVPAIHADEKWMIRHATSAMPFGLKRYQAAPYEICRVALSSGTTGYPKIIELSHSVMDTRLNRPTVNSPSGRTLSMLQLNTAWGFLLLMRTLRWGGAYCFAPFPEDVLELCMSSGVQGIWCSPDQLGTLIQEQKRMYRQLPELGNVNIGGAVLPEAMLRDAQRLICTNILNTYGATETGPVATAPGSRFMGIDGAVGYCLPWLDIQIVDEKDRPLPAEQEGRLRIRGTDVVSGYASVDAESDGVFQNGWFYPGDLASLRRDGLLRIVGRWSEIINRGGVKVAPQIIEEVVRRLHGIEDAGILQGTGPNSEAQIWAAIVADPEVSDDVLREACFEAIGDLTPDRFIRVDFIPRNEVGKVLPRKLREIVEQANHE